MKIKPEALVSSSFWKLWAKFSAELRKNILNSLKEGKCVILLLWFNLSQQPGTTELLAHFPHPPPAPVG